MLKCTDSTLCKLGVFSGLVVFAGSCSGPFSKLCVSFSLGIKMYWLNAFVQDLNVWVCFLCVTGYVVLSDVDIHGYFKNYSFCGSN